MDASRQKRGGDRGSEGGPPLGGNKQTFPRASRLRRRTDFLAVQQAASGGGRGRRITGSRYLVLTCPRPISSGAVSGSTTSRLGITVSRKVGNAVERNRVKRWVRESYRRFSGSLPVNTDLVVIARSGAAQSDFRSTSAELGSLLRRLRS